MDNLPPRCNVLGVGVHTLNMRTAVDVIAAALAKGDKGYVCVSPVHSIIEARRDDGFRNILNRSMLTTPDGMPLVWVGRAQGFKDMDRVYGPDLMLAVCRASVETGWTHFLYGGKDNGALEKLKANLETKFPGIRIVGAYCPPFRSLSQEEDRELVSKVADVRPDLFWVGVGCPKQEQFMAAHLSGLDTKVMLGVGAAFDIHAGLKREPPTWVKRIGMQWFHRFCQEPGRLWRRYLFTNSLFIVLILLQALGLKRFELPPASDRERKIRTGG